MKKYIFPLSLLLLGIVTVLFTANRLLRGPLSNIQKQIDSITKIVYKTGRDSRVTFTFPDKNGILVISPPYANISTIAKDSLSLELRKKMQSYVDSQETGHLFYIERGELVDHRRLSGLAEPIGGMGVKKEVVFLISRKPTSGRPVRIEIANQ
jgi:hypothetical protein